jgi:hypothetical protein
MIGWMLSAIIIVALVTGGIAGFVVPRPAAALYGIVLEEERALALVRAMAVRDLVIGLLLAVVAVQGRSRPLGWSLCSTAIVALADYVLVAADRRTAISGARRPAMDTRALHAGGAVALVVAGTLLLAA